MKEFRKRYYILFLPFSFLYGIVISFRNFFYDKKIINHQKYNFPIITVGNITVGGTGKTPHVEFLVNVLSEKYKIAVISRGYKRKTNGFVLSSNESTVAEIGDEPKQIKSKFKENVIVAVDKDRNNAIKNLFANEIKFDIIILDDAYQYRKIKPDISILLIDYSKPIYKDYLLPSGDLREKARNKNRADIVIITKCPDKLTPIRRRIITKELSLYSFQQIYFTKFKYGKFTHILNNDKTIEINSQYSVLLVTGIANPNTLINYVKSITENIIHKRYPDHYNFNHQDIVMLIDDFDNIKNKNKIILTTEKDAMRLQEFDYQTEKGNLVDKPIYFIPINIIFADSNENEFLKTIFKNVKLNKRNS